MVLDGDVQHRLVRPELHFVNIKLEPVRFVTVARIVPDLLRPSADCDEGEQDGDDGFLVHVN